MPIQLNVVRTEWMSEHRERIVSNNHLVERSETKWMSERSERVIFI